MEDSPDRFWLARLRTKRALGSLPAPIPGRGSAGWNIDAVVVSRLIIALNTVAAELQNAASGPAHDLQAVAYDAADLLWSIGEAIGEHDLDLRMTDAGRPAVEPPARRRCLREPIPQIWIAARLMSDAADAHLAGDRERAANLIRRADEDVIWRWTDSIWGKVDPAIHTFRVLPTSPPVVPLAERPKPRMPSRAVQKQVLSRDGYQCRFCGIPVIPRHIRALLNAEYPEAARWGRRNIEQHAGLQCMWLQFDHVLPNKRGGDSSYENIVVTCAPCNFGRMDWTVEEAGLVDPRDQSPAPMPMDLVGWDGLTRLLSS